MTTLLEAKARQWESEWLAPGVKKGRTEEGLRLIGRLAALKFGARTAERLAELTRGLLAQEHLDLVGDWIIE